MKCEICGVNDASVHFTQIRDDRKSEMHLCKECAKTKGFHSPLDDMPFPLADILTSMVKPGGGKGDPIARLVCPDCGMRFIDFSRIGRFGCGRCYEAFRAPLEDLFRKVHGATKHSGRVVPRRPQTARSLIEEEVRLKEELRRAIEREEFEVAADIRDRLKALGRETPAESQATGQD